MPQREDKTERNRELCCRAFGCGSSKWQIRSPTLLTRLPGLEFPQTCLFSRC
ncbi:hypothetical protein MA16_Dca015787 [Dendrobium catenatum]|uniref:Uncharacterized protein n=1 Tax=Dendrobium catenatum TaxID=906689 RepID=A0A2I0WS76_9ASPA|nr:hypothetical protein MA16_Dca015787 [Dendrobium catenatum]